MYLSSFIEYEQHVGYWTRNVRNVVVKAKGGDDDNDDDDDDDLEYIVATFIAFADSKCQCRIGVGSTFLELLMPEALEGAATR